MSDSTTQPPVGIDLGTTYSVVAFLDPTDRPTTIVNQWGDLLTPSAVLADDGEIVVGREAIKGSTLTPQLFADCFKRDMGSASFRKKIRGLDVPPEVLSAMVLDCLKQGIERRLGTVKQCVITVPAYFDESRRKATQDAGRLAGLDVLDIINEPTAAAVAFGYQQTHSLPTAGAPKQRVMVYDLGGGTFDVSVLEIDGDNFRTLATDGDVQLGGRDFDERLVNYFAEKFLAAHGSDPRNDPQDAAQLLIDARDTKHALTERQRAAAVVFHSGKRMKIDISRADFDNLTADLLGRTEMTSTQVVRESGLEWSDIDRVLLVGGSTRMPMVSAMLQRLSGKTADHSSSPDEVVAHGAALYCGLLMRKGKPKPGGKSFKLVNVNSHSLGVVGLDPQTKRRTNVVLIPKNTALPTHAVKTFRTAKDDQRSVQVTVVEGESLDPTGCITLGQCVLRNLPSGLKAGSVVEVKYAYGANGRIAVSARMPQSGVSMQVELEREQGRDLETLDAWKMRLRGLTPPQAEPGMRSTGGPTAAFSPGNAQAASGGADTVDLGPASAPAPTPVRAPTNPSAMPPSARPRPAPPARSGGGSSPANPAAAGPLPMRPPPPQPTPAPAPAAPMSPAYGQNLGMTPAAQGGYAPQGGSPYGAQPGYAPPPSAPAYAPAPAAPAYGGMPGQGMPSGPMPGYGSPDPAQMSRRLDELFAAIGKAMAGQNTPPQFAGYQQAIAEANREMMQAQQMFQSADLAARQAPPGTPEAHYRGQEVARAMQELGGRQARIDGALVSLGRACVDAGLQHQQLQNELTEIQQLRAVLRR